MLSGLQKISRRDFLKSLGGLSPVSHPRREAKGKGLPAEILSLTNIDQLREVPVVCPGCDSGCGVLLTVQDGAVAGFEGDPDHPVNQGFLCSEGVSLLELSLLRSERGAGGSTLFYRPVGAEAWEVRDWGWVLRSVAGRIRAVGEATLDDEGTGEVRGVVILWADLFLYNEEVYLLSKFARALGIPVVSRNRYPGAVTFLRRIGFPLKTGAELLASERIKGVLIWGGDFLLAEEATDWFPGLEWLALVDWFKSKEELQRKRQRVLQFWPGAAVFLLPAVAPWEKEGSLLCQGRWVQWCARAVEPSGDARAPLWIVDRLFKTVRDAYGQGGCIPDSLRETRWDYGGERIPDINLVAAEVAECVPAGMDRAARTVGLAASGAGGDPVRAGYRAAGMRRSLDAEGWGFLLPQ